MHGMMLKDCGCRVCTLHSSRDEATAGELGLGLWLLHMHVR